jgi:soluble lytic murein transglycosylase
MIFKIIMFAVLSFMPVSAFSAIYGYVDARGVYHFTNIKPAGKQYHTVITDKNMKTAFVRNLDNSSYDSLILHHSKLYGIDPSLVKAVVKAESNFNPNAISPKGAQGLMQLMPDTSKLMKVNNPFDPDENIRGGTKYLKYLEETFKGDLELILAAYNAGPSRVMEHKMNVPPIEETRTFIKRVKQFYNMLKQSNEG